MYGSYYVVVFSICILVIEVFIMNVILNLSITFLLLLEEYDFYFC